MLAALHRGECDGSASVLRSLGSHLSVARSSLILECRLAMN